MRFLILRILTHSELGMFHEYRRQGLEGSKQRAVNFDADVVDRVFPAAGDQDRIDLDLRYDTDQGVRRISQSLKRQDKNWRLEGNCPEDKLYSFVSPGCLFAMEIDAGRTPAPGAWVVFNGNSPVTRAILADGESSRLAASAMIALHDREGLKTWQILAEARPDMFTAPENGIGTVAPSANGDDAVELTPDPGRLVSIIASVGHTMPSAVADLVDNAISANATKIEITFGRPDQGHGRWMSIADNGDGMDQHALAEAMRIGSSVKYDSNSLGKYGFGLKGASWSQTRVFTVVTRRQGGQEYHLTWNVDNMPGWRASSAPLDPWEVEATRLTYGRGTTVLWKNMRPPENMPTMRGLEPHSAEVMELERELALIFHRFLEGKAKGRQTVTITINGVPVEPNNPFGHPLTTHNDTKTIRIPTESIDGLVKVQSFVLPSEAEIQAYHAAEGADAGRRALDRIGLHGKRNETQGLFIYRNDRLIKWGGWHQMWETSDEKTKLARMTVDFDSNLDDAFKINISKRIVQLSQQLQVEIRPLAEIARNDSRKKYSKKGRQPLPPIPPAQPPHITPAPVHGGSGSIINPITGTEPGTVQGGRDVNTPPPSPPLPPAPRVNVREVKTDQFLWKVTKGMTGAVDLQISDMDNDLISLAQRIRSDPQAVAHLAAFLGGLDENSVRTSRIVGRTD